LNQRRRSQVAAALLASQRALAERVSEFQHALEEIESLQQAKADFYSIVTHDLRNPAGNVRVATKILLDEKAGPLTPKQRQFVEVAANAGEKLMRLITDYLDFAKIDAGYLRLDRASTDLVAVARRAAESIELQAGVKGQLLQLHLPDGTVVASADGGKLEQALENLLSNAVKYTPEGGTISLFLEQDDERARFNVRDTGAGIDPVLIPTLFAKYHRLKGHATRATAGTGLGLLISKEIIEAHGGRITVSSSGVAGGARSLSSKCRARCRSASRRCSNAWRTGSARGARDYLYGVTHSIPVTAPRRSPSSSSAGASSSSR